MVYNKCQLIYLLTKALYQTTAFDRRLRGVFPTSQGQSLSRVLLGPRNKGQPIHIDAVEFLKKPQ